MAINESKEIFGATPMKRATPVLLLVVIFLATGTVANEQFGIEERLAEQTNVPAMIAADVEKQFSVGETECLANSKTTARDALEATDLDLGHSTRTLLLKAKQPGESKAAWGCLCGANTCPMWVYSYDGATARRLWSDGGVALEIVDHKDKGMRRLLLSSGSAAYQSATLYAWNGREYVVLREKAFHFSEGDDPDEAEAELGKFRESAARP
jgi:hypothetical protein